MSRETIQIRLAQPPIYLMGAVVLASLLPLFAHLFGGAADGVERLRRLAFAGMNVPQLQPREPAVVALPVEAAETGEAEAIEEDEVEFVEPEPLGPDAQPQPSTRRQSSVVSRATAACARKDKDSARAAYRSLERGDARRKKIRRSCRNAGVWFL